MKSPARFLLLGAIAILQLTAQVVGGIGSTTPTTGGGGQAGSQTNSGLGSGGGIRGGDTSRPIYISGKVVMQDGSLVLQNIAIQRVCGGISKTVAYTDSNGRFSFQWSDRNRIVTDAADAGSGSSRNGDSGGFGNAQSAGGANGLATDPFGSRMLNCELRASLAGFTSDTVKLFNRGIADNPDIGVLVLNRIAGVEGSSISVTSMMAPKDARKAYEQGLHALLKNKPGDASKDFEKAVAVYPDMPTRGWNWVNCASRSNPSTSPGRPDEGHGVRSEAGGAIHGTGSARREGLRTGRNPAGIWIARSNWIPSTFLRSGTPTRSPTTT